MGIWLKSPATTMGGEPRFFHAVTRLLSSRYRFSPDSLMCDGLAFHVADRCTSVTTNFFPSTTASAQTPKLPPPGLGMLAALKSGCRERIRFPHDARGPARFTLVSYSRG